MCRQAMARGQKFLRDHKATYEGEVSWTRPETYALEVVYRQASLVAPVFLEAAQEAGHVPVSRVQDEDREGNLWRWVRSGFAVTVGAGLTGISVGLPALLAVWYRQNRREHRKKVPAPY